MVKVHRSIIIFFTAVFIFSTGALYCDQSIPVKVMKDGQELRHINLLIINKMGYLKTRDVAEIFGCRTDFNRQNKDLFMYWPSRKKEDYTYEVKFQIDSEYVVMEGIKRKMMKTPLLIEGVSYIPLEAVITRAFESVVGAQINWSFPQKTLWVSYGGNISDVRHYTYDNYTRFVVELTNDMQYEERKKNGEIIISIEGGKLTVPAADIDVSDGVIDKITVREKPDSAVFSIKKAENAGEVTIMKYPSPPRIVVDVENKSEAVRTESVENLPPQPAGPPKRDKAYISDIKLVVIDPGHGGKDPGAIGPRGTKEKDITLSIARKLAKKIRKRLKIRAILTRTGDYFVPLNKRTEMANSADADIFISIHANASLKPSSRGFEVYFLSEEASDLEAQAVANMENSVVAMEDETKNMGRVSKILWSLTMNQFMNESSELCAFINRTVISACELIDRGVKQAGFYVMRGARMPAVLVEVAFISNKKEESLLNKDSFQEKVADSICDSVWKYKNWVKRRNGG